jgi:hypothetical protein
MPFRGDYRAPDPTQETDGNTLLPFIKALSDMAFSKSLKIPNKVKKIGATMRIHSK